MSSALRQIIQEYADFLNEHAALRLACSKSNDEICQTLGRALNYPKYADDQENFPGATEADGVCVGDHVAESISEEAAKTIVALQEERDDLRCLLETQTNISIGVINIQVTSET